MGVKLDKIFDSFANNSVFNNKLVLQTNYTPETIPHRDNQIKQIASILAPTLRIERPSNLFLYENMHPGIADTMRKCAIPAFKKDFETCIILDS